MNSISLLMPHEVQASSLITNFLTYESPLIGIIMQYPSNWDQVEEGDNYLRFSSPYESDLDRLRESLVIDIQYLPFQNMFTLDEFVFDPEEGFIVRAERDLINFHRIELDTVTVSNMPAYRLTFTETSMVDGVPHDLKEMFIFVLKNDLVYTIQYFAEPSTFNKYLPLIYRMINSLQITN